MWGPRLFAGTRTRSTRYSSFGFFAHTRTPTLRKLSRASIWPSRTSVDVDDLGWLQRNCPQCRKFPGAWRHSLSMGCPASGPSSFRQVWLASGCALLPSQFWAGLLEGFLVAVNYVKIKIGQNIKNDSFTLTSTTNLHRLRGGESAESFSYDAIVFNEVAAN